MLQGDGTGNRMGAVTSLAGTDSTVLQLSSHVRHVAAATASGGKHDAGPGPCWCALQCLTACCSSSQQVSTSLMLE